MEVRRVSEDPVTLEVFLGGSIHSCIHDTDCPGAAICALNQTWQAKPDVGMCMCNSWFGFTGALCKDLCSEGEAFLGINIVTGIIGLVVACWATYLFVTLVRTDILMRKVRAITRRNSAGTSYADQPQLIQNPVAITLFFSALGGLMFIVFVILDSITTVGFAHFYVILVAPLDFRQTKRPSASLEDAVAVTQALAFCFSVCAVVILPKTWVDVTRKSVRLKKSNTLSVAIFASVFVFVTLGVELTFYIFIASDFRGSNDVPWTVASSIVWAVIFSSLILLNLVVFWRVYSIMKQSNIEKGSGLFKLLRRIQIASVLLAILSVGAFICIGVLGWIPSRSYYTNPYCYLDSLSTAIQFGRLFIILGNLVCVWFVAYPVNNLRNGVREKARRNGLIDDAKRRPSNVVDPTMLPPPNDVQQRRKSVTKQKSAASSSHQQQQQHQHAQKQRCPAASATFKNEENISDKQEQHGSMRQDGASRVNRSLSSLQETDGGEGLVDDSSNENLYEERMAGDPHRSHQKQQQHGKGNNNPLAKSGTRMGSPLQQLHQTGSQQGMRGSLLRSPIPETSLSEDDDDDTKKKKGAGAELNLT